MSRICDHHYQMQKENNPLAEVFGHLTSDSSPKAQRFRKNKLCPFNNKVPSCTKDKAKKPLGVCSVNTASGPVITCPIRFREDWLITDDAADFFFPENATWTSLTEVRLPDAEGRSAGNIDVVLVAYDEVGQVYDFGSLEIQAVYISGNIRDPFERYISNTVKYANLDWSAESNYPRPDFLSSSRKRLAPQLLFKGGILDAWGKKMAVALDSHFFSTLPKLEEVCQSDADVAWLIYDLVLDPKSTGYNLTKSRVIYTRFSDALNTITRPKVGDVGQFIGLLQSKVDDKLESAPINKTLSSPFDD